MDLIWGAIKQSVGDIWDEMLYLILFNLVWLIGTVLIIPWPFVTFGYFSLVYDIGLGKGIKIGTFFRHGRRMWKQAYIWGGINLGILIVLGINLNFYANARVQWAAIVQLVLVAIAIFWAVLQLVMLPLYPRLEGPSFKLALRNALIVVGRYPLAILTLIIIVALVVVASSIFPVLAFLAALAIIAVVANRMVGAIIDRETKREGEA